MVTRGFFTQDLAKEKRRTRLPSSRTKKQGQISPRRLKHLCSKSKMRKSDDDDGDVRRSSSEEPSSEEPSTSEEEEETSKGDLVLSEPLRRVIECKGRVITRPRHCEIRGTFNVITNAKDCKIHGGGHVIDGDFNDIWAKCCSIRGSHNTIHNREQLSIEGSSNRWGDGKIIPTLMGYAM